MSKIPVKQGQEIKVHIQSVNSHGQGVAKVDNYVVFVAGALPGENCTIRINKILTKYSLASVVKRHNDSKLRVKPRCAYYGKCGGCQLQHVNYKAQLLIKQKSIIDAFKKSGMDIAQITKPTIGMNNPYNYRNKAMFSVGKLSGKGAIGMYYPNSHKIIDIDECHLVNKNLNSLLPVTRSHLKYLYGKDEHFDLPFSKVFGRVGNDSQMMAGFVGRGDVGQYHDSLIVNLRRENNDIVSIFYNKTEDDSGNLSRNNNYLYGRKTIDGSIGRFKFDISPNSFFQVNTAQTIRLYEVIRNMVDEDENQLVFDLYCGVGTIGMYIADKVKKVIGIESVVSAVENATINAKRNNVRNIEFLKGECEKLLPSLAKSDIAPDTVIVDPPRKGVATSVVKSIIHAEPKKIIYVSCNPATLARDANLFTRAGYEIAKVQPVDMFPQTTHVECVCLLVRL